MIFADKLIALRKKAGYSQEELAQQLNVTRQSVSKWEGAQSVPDIEKILQISKLFGVTTDYLLKDEMGEPEYAESEPTPLRRVTLEQANAALAQAKVNAPLHGVGNRALCCFTCYAAAFGRNLPAFSVWPERECGDRYWPVRFAGNGMRGCGAVYAVRHEEPGL